MPDEVALDETGGAAPETFQPAFGETWPRFRGPAQVKPMA